MKSACVLAIVSSFLAPLAVRAQSVEVAFAPRATEIRVCDELFVDVRVRATGIPVGGYQFFLRFPAEHFDIARFEPEAISASVVVAGPAPFGSGFASCPGEDDDRDDGFGLDVVAIGATIIGEGDDDPVIVDGEAILGTLVFRPRGILSTGVAAFSLESESCSDIVDQRSKVFGPEGAAVAATIDAAFVVDVLDRGVAVTGLTCVLDDQDRAVIGWTAAPPSVTGVRITRDGAVVSELPATATSFTDEVDTAAKREYRVVFVVGSLASCDAATCSVERTVTFRRGDIDTNGSFNITDAVELLGQLFRGLPVTCADASDVNDDGRMNISDPAFLLNFLFRSAEEPPLPFPDAGADPTPDTLDCADFS
jgi:hypothetical protein